MRQTWDLYWLDVAKAASTRATCPRLHVGAVIVKENRIISTGYNGSEPAEPHCDDVGCLLVNNRCTRTVHAEDNAIRHSNWRKRCGATLYCTHAPCSACVSKIVRAGIAEVVFRELYKNSMPDLQPYHENGIVVRQA